MNNELDGVEKARPISRVNVIGVSGVERYGGYIYEEFLTALSGDRYLKEFKEMAYNDATVGAILFIFEQMTKKVTWEVEAASDSQEDKKVATFLEECRDDMSHPWSNFISDILSCFIYGWSWHELCYKYRRGENEDLEKSSKYSDGKIGWSKIAIRLQTSWNRWVYDENNPDKLIGMEQLAANVNKPTIIPLDKSLHFRAKLLGTSPEGISLLRNAWRAWRLKKRIEEIEGIGIERDLAGLPVLYAPVDIFDTDNPDAVTLKASLEKLISNVRRDKFEGLLFPDTYKFELVSTGGTRQFDTTAIINRYDQRIAMTLLSDIVMLGTERAGSFALADVKKSMLALAVEALVGNIAEVINKFAIPRLIKLNGFGVTEFPKFVPSEIETPDMVEFADALQRFMDMGFVVFPNPKVEEYIWKQMGLPNYKGNKNKNTEAIVPEKNNGGEGEENLLTPRQRGEHMTDDKTRFNETYERNGLKKIADALNKLVRKKDKT